MLRAFTAYNRHTAIMPEPSAPDSTLFTDIESLTPTEPIRRPRRTSRVLLTALLVLAFACGLVSMVGAAAFSGAQAGQQEAGIRRTATIAAYIIDRFDKGNQQLREGNYTLAQANFEEILKYQPENYGVRNMAATAIAAQTPTPTTPAPTPTPVITDKGELFRMMQTKYQAEEWDAVISLAEQLIALDSSYEQTAVSGMRYDALVTRGLQRVRGDQIEQGIFDLDEAAKIKPLSGAAEGERQLASAYQDALYYVGADWNKANELLEALYNAAPRYRDVGRRLYLSYAQAGDAFAAVQDWCPAAQKYARASQISPSATIDQKRANADTRCLTATPTGLSAGTGASTTVFNTAGISGRLFYSKYDPTTNLYRYYLYDPASSTAYETGSGQGPNYRPSAGPDGRITYQVFQDGAWKVVIANRDGSNPTILTDGTYPAWGPNGYIAYQNCTDQCGIYLINPNQPTDVRRLTSSAGDIGMAWSPAGDKLIYMSNVSGGWEIYTVSMAGGFQQLTGTGAINAAPAFSPDGSRVAFISNRDGAWGVWIMNADGGNPMKLIDLGAQYPSWQSEKLVWTQ
jgi:tetratricopeptide (TPR) repeat protein